MRKLLTLEALLNFVRSRPALCWGGGDRPFTRLTAFIAGYRFHELVSNNKADLDLIPDGFQRFVADTLGVKSHPAAAWNTFIEQNTSNEEEAFELFFKLRKEFETKRKRRVTRKRRSAKQ